MERIDTKKLRQAIAELNIQRNNKENGYPTRPPSGCSNEEFYTYFRAWYDHDKKYGIKRANVLYSMAAECHKKLHIKKQWIATCDADGGLVLVEKTHEDQLKLIGEAWKEFKREDRAVSSSAERQE